MVNVCFMNSGLSYTSQGERKVLKTQIRKAGITKIEKEEKKETVDDNLKRKNFEALCREFPDVAFVVRESDMWNGNADYNGICNTNSFSYPDKVSIVLDEEILEKYEKDYRNIIGTIRGIINNYGQIQANARGVHKYTAVNLHYALEGLSFNQTLWPDAVSLKNNSSSQNAYPQKKSNINTGDNHYQALLMKIQHDSLEKLYNLGENKVYLNMEKCHAAQAKKGTMMYQKNFLYK